MIWGNEYMKFRDNPNLRNIVTIIQNAIFESP